MNANFFNQVAQLDFIGVLQLHISKGAENNLVVSVLLNNDKCGDNAKNLIPPLIFNSSPQEFDDHFFEKITAPIQKVSGLMVDMELFLKQLEEAKKQSTMEKNKLAKIESSKTEKEKKYEACMKKANELEAEGKYREAWMKVPDITEFSDKAEEIRKRKTELSDKFSAPNLFGATQNF